jgi:flagellar hook-associated protein 3 FlgL
MRIGTATLAQQGLTAILDQQARLARIQQQISSGRKDASAADNPADVAAAMGYDNALAQLDRFGKNAEVVSNRLGLEDNALGQVSDTLQRIRELALQANNATQDDVSRRSTMAELRTGLRQLVDLANSDDGQGRYLFGGTNDATAPFSFGGVVSYAGDANTRRIDVGPGTSVADGDNGRDVFLNLTTGNGVFAARAAATNTGTLLLKSASVADATQWDGGSYALNFTSPTTYEVRDSVNALVGSGTYTAGQAISFRGVSVTLEGNAITGDGFSVAPGANTDLFSIAQNLIDTLGVPQGSVAGETARHNGMYASIEDLDRALDQILNTRASVGARISEVKDAQSSQESLSLQLAQSLSDARDTNFTQAVSELQLRLTTLQAAQQSFLKIQGLSLFDYIR